MKMLGHRNIQNALRYVQLPDSGSDEYHSATAKTVEETKTDGIRVHICMRHGKRQTVQHEEMKTCTIAVNLA